MKVVIYNSQEEQAIGLQFRKRIEADTLFVFPLIRAGSVFHSRNVAERFDLAFLAPDRTVLWKGVITPTLETAAAPKGATMALEAKEGWLSAFGVEVGRRAAF
jgi:uncharacterized membrane protein (UPF0127 family)